MNRITRSVAVASAVGITSLAIAGTASAQPVQSLFGDWKASNSTVAKTADGVHFGTYADGGSVGGSVLYKGFDGKLGDVSNFSFNFTYNQAGALTGATPYGRIWLDTDENGTADATVMFDPSLGGRVLPLVRTDLTFGTDDDSVRYDDDKGNSDQLTWAKVKADHANERVIQIGVTQGYSMGTDVSAMLKSLTINDKAFDFNVAPADGTNGINGKDGKDGANGSNGRNGVDGSNGANVLNASNGKDSATTIIRESAGSSKLVGASLRKLTVPTMKGGKLVSVKATLRGKKLSVKGNKVSANLTGMSVGNYNVSIVAKFKKHGKMHTVRQTRSLSITLAA